MKLRRLVPIALLLATAPAEIRAARLPLRHYTTEHGLSHDLVGRIRVDSRGYLWLCTGNGLDLFDGSAFIVLGWRQGLSAGSTTDLREDPRGFYWVSTWGSGIFRFDPDPRDPNSMFLRYPVGVSPETNRVHEIHLDRAGLLWAGTLRGLFVMDAKEPGASFQEVELPPARASPPMRRIWTILEDRRGTLWLGTTGGLLRRTSDGRTMIRPLRPGAAPVSIRCMMEDGEGRIWVGLETGVVVFVPEPVTDAAHTGGAPTAIKFVGRFGQRRSPSVALPSAPGETLLLTEADGVARGIVTSILSTSDGRVWLTAYEGGLTEFDGSRFLTHAPSEGFSRAMSRLAEDAEGNLWIGSHSEGVARLARSGFTALGADDGLDYLQRPVLVAATGGEAVILVGSFLKILREGAFQSVRLDLPVVETPSVLRDRVGGWWFGTPRGLYRFAAVDRPERLSHARPSRIYRAEDGLPGDVVHALCEDGRGDVWISAGDPPGLVRWERSTERFRRFGQEAGILEVSELLSCVSDAGGHVWLTIGGDLLRFEEGRFRRFGPTGQPPTTVANVFLDGRGRLWVARATVGLLRADNPSADGPVFRSYSVADGLSSNSINGIAEDSKGRLYLATTNGVDRLDPQSGQIRRYTIADGLVGNEVSQILRDGKDRLWFASPRNGVSVLSPEAENAKALPAPVRIVGVRAGGTALPVSVIGEPVITGFALPHSRAHLDIDFAGLSFGPGGGLRFQYRLEGFDEDWSAPTADRAVHYASLSPGRYRFLVRAVNAEGTLSERPAEVAFVVTPPLWRRWWFLASCAAAVAAACLALHRRRVFRAVELERVRTRIAADLHDDIGASLSRIAILSEVAQRRLDGPDASVREPLARIAASSRELVDAMGDIVWAVNPRCDSLGDVTQRMRRYASETLGARGVEVSFRFPEDGAALPLGADVRRHLHLILKESVNNAARHSGCAHVEVAVEAKAGRLSLQVRDDGSGFDTAAVEEGHGLDSMRRRARELGGDLTIAAAPGRGTTVRADLPLRSAGRRWALRRPLPVRVGRFWNRKRNVT